MCDDAEAKVLTSSWQRLLGCAARWEVLSRFVVQADMHGEMVMPSTQLAVGIPEVFPDDEALVFNCSLALLLRHSLVAACLDGFVNFWFVAGVVQQMPTTYVSLV